MAKTESTAINDLIDLVQKKQPAPPASAELFARNPPRMSATTVPSMKAAADIAPLPRNRAPQATREQPVRMRAASPPRGTTIPPLPRRSAPAGTMAPPTGLRPPARPSAPPPLPTASIRSSAGTMAPPAGMRAPAPAGTLPPPMRASAPAATFPPPVHAAAPSLPSPFQAPPPAPMVQPQFPMLSPPNATNDHWYEQQRPTLLTGIRPREQSDTAALIKKLIAPGIMVIAAGIVIGAVIATGRKSTIHAHPTPAATAPAPARPTSRTPAPGDEEQILRPSLPRAESENAATATAGGGDAQPPTKAEQAAQIAAAAAMSGTLTHDAPKAAVAALDERSSTGAVHEVKTPKGVVKLIDVRIDSSPSGATVTLVDAGVQSFLGTTPLSTSVDAARQYDVIVALDGRPTRMVHLDPNTAARLDVSLGTAHHAAPAVAQAAAPHAAATHVHAVKAVAVTSPEPTSEPAAPNTASPASGIADPFGDSDAKGTLMVSSKPPCDLVIDGTETGLHTPQRSIELAPGTHEVTFVNDAEGIKKTFSVTIKSGKPTKLIQDLMKP